MDISHLTKQLGTAALPPVRHWAGRTHARTQPPLHYAMQPAKWPSCLARLSHHTPTTEE